MYDLIVKNGIIVDGTASPPFIADIGIKSDLIVKIGDLSGERAEVVINANKNIVAPGFIDIHNHSDISIFVVPTADNYVLQGVTTIVIGNCGFSPAPITDKNTEIIEEAKKQYPEVEVKWRTFNEYLEALNALEKSINVVPLVGFGAIRSAILGFEDTKPTTNQLNEMKELVKEAMDAGAFGLSTGLIYTPQNFADTNEIIELCKIVSKFNGIYATHMRNEGTGLIDSIIEAITIGRNSSCPIEISHLKSVGIPAWGLVREGIKIIEYYANKGFDVSADVYPYTATSTSLSAILPPWIREGGTKRMLERLKDPNVPDKIAREFEEYGIMEERYIEWWQIAISWSPNHSELEGKNIEDISREWGLDSVKTIIKLLLDDEGLTEALFHTLNEEDVRYVIKSPYTAIGSDGSIKKFGEGKPHPRNYGTFPRIIAKYVREEKILSLPEAIRKMTSMPARKLKLWDRGILRPGMKADIVIFNYYTIRDTATYANPHSYPKGIEYVIINGNIVVEEGKHTGRKPGKLLKHEA